MSSQVAGFLFELVSLHSDVVVVFLELIVLDLVLTVSSLQIVQLEDVLIDFPLEVVAPLLPGLPLSLLLPYLFIQLGDLFLQWIIGLIPGSRLHLGSQSLDQKCELFVFGQQEAVLVIDSGLLLEGCLVPLFDFP